MRRQADAGGRARETATPAARADRDTRRTAAGPRRRCRPARRACRISAAKAAGRTGPPATRQWRLTVGRLVIGGLTRRASWLLDLLLAGCLADAIQQRLADASQSLVQLGRFHAALPGKLADRRLLAVAMFQQRAVRFVQFVQRTRWSNLVAACAVPSKAVRWTASAESASSLRATTWRPRRA